MVDGVSEGKNMNTSPRNVLAISVVITTVACGLFIGLTNGASSQALVPRDPVPGDIWPSFKANVTVETPSGTGQEDSMHRLVYDVDYKARNEWVSTILSDNENPEIVGMVHSVSGRTRTVSRPDFPDVVHALEEKEIASPGRWLALWETVPDMSRSVVSPGVIELRRAEAVQCGRTATCPRSLEGQTVDFSQRVVVDESTRVPILVEESLGQIVIYRASIESLKGGGG